MPSWQHCRLRRGSLHVRKGADHGLPTSLLFAGLVDYRLGLLGSSPPPSSVGERATDEKPAIETPGTTSPPSQQQGPSQEEAESIDQALAEHGVDLHFYTYPSGRIELKESALDSEGKLKPEVLDLLKKFTAPNTSISFDDGPNEVTDATLTQLAELPCITTVFLHRMNQVTNAGLDSLALMHQLRTIQLHLSAKGQFNDEGLAKLAQIPALEHLLISELTDGSFLAAFSEHPRLNEVNFGNDNLSDAGLAKVTALPHLEKFNVSGSNITGDGLAFLKQAHKLQIVDFMYCDELTDAATANIAGLPELTRVNISGSGDDLAITDSSLESLSMCPKLEDLHIRGAGQVTDAGVAFLANLKDLKTLNLEKCEALTDASFDHLAKIATLERLEMSDCPHLTDAGIQKLKPLTNLQGLHVKGSAVTVAGADQLKLAMPNLKHVSAEPRKQTPGQ